MNVQRDPDEILAAWLDEGPLELPSGTKRAIVTALPTTPQVRRNRLAPGRNQMIPFARFAAMAAVVVVAFGAAILILRPAPSIVSGPPGSPPVPSFAPSPPASPQPSDTSGRESESPSQGRAVDFPVAFSYRLPAGAGLVVSDGPYPNTYQFRHPSGPDTYDSGVIVRAISGGRADPCSDSPGTRDLAGPDAIVAYFRTVPTMEVSKVTASSVNGHPAKQVNVHFAAATASCPDLWLWAEDGSITQNTERADVRMTVFDVGQTHIVILTYGPIATADAFIASLRFDTPGSPASSG